MTEEEYILGGILWIIWIEFLWDFYLTYRQHQKYVTEVSIPQELREVFSEQTYTKARLYGYDKGTFSMFSNIYAVIISTVVIVFYFLHVFWTWSYLMLQRFGLEGEIWQSAMFTFIVNSLNTVIALPLSIYNTFVLEEKHGFNKQTAGFFVKDKIKAYIISQIIIIPLTCAAVYTVKIGGDFFFVYLWLLATFALVFLITIYPTVIAPLFDKYTPIPEGDLKNKIEELAKSINFPLTKIYIVEGSKRSDHSNAYFYGFFNNKRIVLFDTLLKGYTKDQNKDKGCDTDEILAVLAHELGHWKYNHMLKNTIIVEVNVFLLFLAFGFLFQYPQLYSAFDFTDEQPVIIGFIIILQFILSPYETVVAFFQTVLSRKFEFQADAFAKSLGKSENMKKALIKLTQDNLSFPVYDWLYSAWHHTHPPLLQRLAALSKED